MKTKKPFSSSFVSSDPELTNSDFESTLSRLKQVYGVKTDTALAKSMRLSQGAVSSAKSKRAIPPSWITETSLSEGVSADWLLFGRGEMQPGLEGGRGKAEPPPLSVRERPARYETRPQAAAHLSREALEQESGRAERAEQEWKISDMLAKTAEILESDTIYKDALAANVNAFHRALLTERRMDSFEQRLKELEEKCGELMEENGRLRRQIQSLESDLLKHDCDDDGPAANSA